MAERSFAAEVQQSDITSDVWDFIGDGKVFVSAVLDAIRIRTGERGADAVSSS